MEFVWDIAAVVGVPGVGKTSLCESVSETIRCNHINYGDLMLEIARSKRLASSDHEMFALDLDVQYCIWEDAALEIKNMGNVLVDLHGIDQSQIGYILSLPIEILSPDIIVIIESSEENILKRRHVDKSKKRVIEEIKSIREHMEMLRGSMLACSVLVGCTVAILKNNAFDECLEKMVRLLSKGYI